MAKFVTVEHTFEDEVELDEDEAEDDKDEASVVATRECKAPFDLLLGLEALYVLSLEA